MKKRTDSERFDEIVCNFSDVIDTAIEDIIIKHYDKDYNHQTDIVGEIRETLTDVFNGCYPFVDEEYYFCFDYCECEYGCTNCPYEMKEYQPLDFEPKTDDLYDMVKILIYCIRNDFYLEPTNDEVEDAISVFDSVFK